MYESFIALVRNLYPETESIGLHEPVLDEADVEAVTKVIRSGYVSTVGEEVNQFERAVAKRLNASHAVACVNGTSALHIALLVAGVEVGDEVVTQSMTFVGTCNAIRYCGAEPVFLDIDPVSKGMSPQSLSSFFESCEIRDDGFSYNVNSGRRVAACLPVHTFGHPCDIHSLHSLCQKNNVMLIEDAAESIGSTRFGQAAGTIGDLGILSFNGNKILTTGGGGMILTGSEDFADRARHLSTTGRYVNGYEFEHDVVGYNYRMPNLNAALGISQLAKLDSILKKKKALASRYANWCSENEVAFGYAPPDTDSNYWLITLQMESRGQRDEFLRVTNSLGVMTRPVWRPMHELPMFSSCQKLDLCHTRHLSALLVNVPSSVGANI